MALKFLLILLACLLCLAALAEARLRALAWHGEVDSVDWHRENANIAQMNKRKVLASRRDPIWQSAGMPLRAKPAGTHRILVIGDSFVWGDGAVNANDLWWRQLQRELQRRGYRDVDVVAAGVNGASTQDQLRWLRELQLLERTQADLVVLGYVTNDPDVRRPDGQPYVARVGRDTRSYSSGALRRLALLTPNVALQLEKLRRRKWESRRGDAYPYDVWELKLLEGANFAAYGAVVRDMAALLDSHHVPAFVVTLPSFPSPERFEPRYRPVEALFNEAGLPFHDVVEDFVRAFPTDDAPLLKWGLNPANGHPAPITTRFYARETADILERNYASLLGPRSRPPEPLPVINDWLPADANVRQIGPSDWELDYPVAEYTMPVLPIGQRHQVLSFAEPVVIRHVRVQGEHLQQAQLYLTPDGVSGADRDDHINLGQKSGRDLSWSLPPGRASASVSRLELAAVVAQAPARRVGLPTRAIEHDEGLAYAVKAPRIDEAGSLGEAWLLEEDGRPLDRAQSTREDIRKRGRGRWVQSGTMVAFSSSDGTDPRANGRRYELVRPDASGRTLRVHIDFDRHRVRP